MKNTCFTILVLFSFTFASSQSEPHLQSGHFGFSIGIDYTQLKVSTLSWDQYKIADEINSLTGTNSFGFSIGVAYFYELDKSFTLRPQAIFSFQSNELNYDFVSLENYRHKVQPATLEMPIHLIYTNREDKYFMPALIMGLQYIRDVSIQSSGQKLHLRKNNFAFDVGAGLDVHFIKIKMRPELIYSMSMRGLDTFKNDIYHKALSGLSKDKISVRVSFYMIKGK